MRPANFIPLPACAALSVLMFALILIGCSSRIALGLR